HFGLNNIKHSFSKQQVELMSHSVNSVLERNMQDLLPGGPADTKEIPEDDGREDQAFDPLDTENATQLHGDPNVIALKLLARWDAIEPGASESPHAKLA